MSKVDKIFASSAGILGLLNILISFGFAWVKQYPAANWHMSFGFLMIFISSWGFREAQNEYSKK